MAIIDRRGKPLPPTHPFATPRVLFGFRRPRATPKDSAPDAPKDANVGDQKLAGDDRAGQQLDGEKP